MLQWQECKAQAKGALLLFRMGDFYEAFFEDAEILAREAEVALTKRQEVPMSGVPAHSVDGYIDRMVARGYQIAVAEQVEEQKKGKALLRREVVRIVTAGTLIDSALLKEKKHNFFCAIVKGDGVFGLAFLDVTTGDFLISEVKDLTAVKQLIESFRPTEFLLPDSLEDRSSWIEETEKGRSSVNIVPAWHVSPSVTHPFLKNHLQVSAFDGFGAETMDAALCAAGGLLRYLQGERRVSVAHVHRMRTHVPADFMLLDAATRRHLDLTTSPGGPQHTLFGVMDHTLTPMGGRLLRAWLEHPLLSAKKIGARQQQVNAFFSDPHLLESLRGHLQGVRDLERLMTKVVAKCASPRDLLALARSLVPLRAIQETLKHSSVHVSEEVLQIHPIESIVERVCTTLVDDPPAKSSDGMVIRSGFYQELDQLRSLSQNGRSWLVDYQAELRANTGIKTLKVSYNRVFGYYISVSRAQEDRVPSDFSLRQTLANEQRYITPMLKEYEHRVLVADERSREIESALFETLREEIATYSAEVFRTAHAVALLDCYTALAHLALHEGYVCPHVDEGFDFHVEEGRHPVLEKACRDEKFVPNHTLLTSQEPIWVITGPNMGGKSTYLRQVALIAIMAQVGSFVPARCARIGIVDRVFTRIGASDDLATGRSTFMVEMSEAAYILHHITPRSLILFDEIGRGTSTYDGIAIAWSIIEFLVNRPQRPKTLFATHYWEMTRLEERFSTVKNYHVAVEEQGERLRFLRKIVKGKGDKSYGIHVARLAGLPREVIARAGSLLTSFERKRQESKKKAFPEHGEQQLLLFDL